jgi:hypothetical protein
MLTNLRRHLRGSVFRPAQSRNLCAYLIFTVKYYRVDHMKPSKIHQYAHQIGLFNIAFEVLVQSIRRNFMIRFSSWEKDQYLCNLLLHDIGAFQLIHKLEVLLKYLSGDSYQGISKLVYSLKVLNGIRNEIIHGMWGLGIANKFIGEDIGENIVTMLRRPKYHINKDIEMKFIPLEDVESLKKLVIDFVPVVDSLCELTAMRKHEEVVDQGAVDSLVGRVKEFEKKWEAFIYLNIDIKS